jgi:hypothetical protein
MILRITSLVQNKTNNKQALNTCKNAAKPVYNLLLLLKGAKTTKTQSKYAQTY